MSCVYNSPSLCWLLRQGVADAGSRSLASHLATRQTNSALWTDITLEYSCSNLCKGLTSNLWVFFTQKVYSGGHPHLNIRQYGLVRLLCIILKPFKEPGASQLATDGPEI